MLKMFSTQLSGLFKRLQDNNEEAIEDSARLLAQAIVSEGRIYVYATDEMAGVIDEAIYGLEPLANIEEWKGQSLDSVRSSDRFLLFSRTSSDEEILRFATELEEAHISFIAVSSNGTESNELQELADVHIDLKLTKPLLPDDEGNRYGYPSLIAALFVYHGIKFTIDEIVKEYDI
ncbi:MAG TPA: DUF2529 domain-containing protein [Niallia sp.]|nr:DUF2529 domain-containing protein [Niallia sp.]